MTRIIATLALTMVAACTPGAPGVSPAPPVAGMVTCAAQRPEMCTREYRPVCAQRDTGVRCVKAPCPSTESVTLGNACSACSDPKVSGYTPGACPGSLR